MPVTVTTSPFETPGFWHRPHRTLASADRPLTPDVDAAVMVTTTDRADTDPTKQPASSDSPQEPCRWLAVVALGAGCGNADDGSTPASRVPERRRDHGRRASHPPSTAPTPRPPRRTVDGADTSADSLADLDARIDGARPLPSTPQTLPPARPPTLSTPTTKGPSHDHHPGTPPPRRPPPTRRRRALGFGIVSLSALDCPSPLPGSGGLPIRSADDIGGVAVHPRP